jgi:ABC-type antimicrobial peptide transport system ATPase subunit
VIPTPASRRKINRRLDREQRQAEQVLATMRDRGVSLRHLAHGGWRLSNGQRVSPAIANILTLHHNVVACGDSLLGPELSQTWRWLDPAGSSR